MTYHPGLMEGITPQILHRITVAGVPIAEAAAPHNHLVDSVVVLLEGVAVPSSKQSIPEGMEFSEIDP